jgi:hypothetical protein
MALVKTTLQAAIFKAFKDQQGKTDNPDGSLENIADQLATAIENYIKSGTVIVDPGIPVSTAGTAAAQTGATTAPGTGQII